MIEQKVPDAALEKLSKGARAYSNESRDMAIELLAYRQATRKGQKLEWHQTVDYNGFKIQSRFAFPSGDLDIEVMAPSGTVWRIRRDGVILP